jgi:hypothetical protein
MIVEVVHTAIIRAHRARFVGPQTIETASGLRLEAEKFIIRLRRPFRIAHGSSVTRETILVHLHDEKGGIGA